MTDPEVSQRDLAERHKVSRRVVQKSVEVAIP